MQSEMHQKFQKPILKKPPVTRARRYEQFLWHEFYDEYIRSKEQLEAMQHETPKTEYLDEFSKIIPDLVKNGNELDVANKFPLYSTAAISLWNPNGEPSCFGKIRSVTLSTSEQIGQFDV